MALKRIGEDNSSLDDLLWVNEYLDQGGSEGDSTFVREVKKSPKGYLILGEDFKGFLFAKSQIAKYFEEALSVWVSNRENYFPVFAIADKGGKLSLALDDEGSLTHWVEVTKGKAWEQKRKKEQGGTSVLPTSNPFLPKPSPTMSGKRGSSKEAPTAATLAS